MVSWEYWQVRGSLFQEPPIGIEPTTFSLRVRPDLADFTLRGPVNLDFSTLGAIMGAIRREKDGQVP